MVDTSSSGMVGKLKTTTNAHWVAGLVVAAVLGLIFSLIVMGITNLWAVMILGGLLKLVLAAGVGFAVRLTSVDAGTNTFVAALVTGGLGIHTITFLEARGFDYFDTSLYSAFAQSFLTAYVLFFGVIAALVATVGRNK